jgi:diadenosine tetraphosphate (Ap4A) HIT family hydrolase
MTEMKCPLCAAQGETVVFTHPKFRIIQVSQPEYPVYFRLIWKEHVREVSDLSEEDGLLLWKALRLLEREIIAAAHPDKINWAQFGNQVPHLHWHLIGRWADDVSFPDSAWSAPKRSADENKTEERRKLSESCAAAIRSSFEAAWPSA